MASKWPTSTVGYSTRFTTSSKVFLGVSALRPVSDSTALIWLRMISARFLAEGTTFISLNASKKVSALAISNSRLAMSLCPRVVRPAVRPAYSTGTTVSPSSARSHLIGRENVTCPRPER